MFLNKANVFDITTDQNGIIMTCQSMLNKYVVLFQKYFFEFKKIVLLQCIQTQVYLDQLNQAIEQISSQRELSRTNSGLSIAVDSLSPVSLILDIVDSCSQKL